MPQTHPGSEPGASTVSVTANARISDRVVLSLFSLVVVGSEVGRLAELARSPNSYLTPSLQVHTPLLGV